MGHRFGQLDGPVHRVNLAWFDLDPALLLAVRTIHPAKFPERHLASPLFLDRPAELLAQVMSRDFDLVKMGHSIPLIQRLDLSCRLGRFLQLNFELFFELSSFRVHANPSPRQKNEIPSASMHTNLPTIARISY